MRRRLFLSLVFIIVAAGLGLGSTLAAGWGPVLGLDLQGGASVVLEPVEEVDDDVLNQAIEIIRNRVDALGVAEPDIARQGDSVIVQLPGVDEQQRALDVVGETAELRFRPVLEVLPPEEPEAGPDGGEEATTTTAPVAGEDGTTTTVAETTTTTAPAEADEPVDDPEAEVVLPAQEDEDGTPPVRYRLGPAALRGEAVKTAQAAIPDGFQWVVDLEFTGEGGRQFDQLAQLCFVGAPECPAGVAAPDRGAVAIVLDGEVVSAPAIQQADFQGRAQISGDFTEGEAKDLALVLRYGALPVQLEPLTTQSVSATLGRDSLRAGLIAGGVGVLLVALYLILYYRLLGAIGVLSLGVSGALLWTIIAVLGEQQGLALTLAGITGIIVSIGVAVDSNVVYYERVKEDVLGGRSLRAASDRGFKRAFSTILRADFTSLIGAGLLYYFTVGPVRGFAFYLGLSTLIDIVTSWFFMRPAVILVSRSRRLGRPAWLGIPRSDGTPAAAGGTA